MKKIAAIIVVLAILLFAFARVHPIVEKQVSSQIYSEIEDLPAKQIVLILGAQVYADQSPADVYLDRIETGLAVFEAGKADRLLVSGSTEGKHYDEVTPVFEILRSESVHESKIVLDYAGFDTYDSLYRAKNTYGFDSMIIVTQDFHMPRALFIANNLGIDAVGMLANSGEYFYNTSLNTREQLAIFKAIFDILFKVKPSTQEIRTSNPAFNTI